MAINPFTLNTLAEVQRLCRLVKSFSLNPMEKMNPSEVQIASSCEETTCALENFFIKTNNKDHYFVLLNNRYYLYKIINPALPEQSNDDIKTKEIIYRERQVVESLHRKFSQSD